MQERSMRRSVIFQTLLIPLAVAACEDGPNQTFQPAAGTLFNNGNTPAAVNDAGDPLSSTFGGSTKTQICSGDELQKQWGAMDSQAIAPVRYIAGIDLDDGPTFPLLTVEKAETGPTSPITHACVTIPSKSGYGAVPGVAMVGTDPCSTNTSQKACADAFNAGSLCAWNVIPYIDSKTGKLANLDSNPPAPTRLCQPQDLGQGSNGADVGGSLVSGFGNAAEFYLEWAVPTHKAYFIQVTQGYVGHMQWNYVTPSDGKMHYYDAAIGIPITKDGANYEIDWTNTAKSYQQGDEIYRGVASTFAPDVYDNAPPGVTLADTGTGFVRANVGGGSGEIGMRPTSFYIVFFPNTLGAAEGVTVLQMYAFNIKYAPYSGAVSYFKIFDPTNVANAEPVATAVIGNKGTGGAGVPCAFGIGDTFDNLLTNCIDVFNSATANSTAEAKVLGNLAHDDQNYTFSVVGITQNFRPAKLDVCTPDLTKAGINCGTDIEDVIHDNDSLVADAKNATSNEFSADVRSFGAIQNDSFPPGTPISNVLGLAAPVPCTAATAATDCEAQNTGGVAAVCHTDADANNNTCVTAAWNHDWHGAGAIWREFGRLTQKDLNAKYVALHGNNPALVKQWHDQSCFFPMSCQGSTGATPTDCATKKESTTPPTVCSATITCPAGSTCYTAASTATLTQNTCITSGSWATSPVMEMVPPTLCTALNAATVCTQTGATCYTGATGGGLTTGTCVVPFNAITWRPAQGCTGFESMATCAEPAPDGSALYPTAGDDLFDNPGAFGGAGIAMKPGDPTVFFCNDPGTFNFCNTTAAPGATDLLTVSAAQVLGYLGNGNVLNVPLDGRDKRYYFQMFSTAYAKYLRSPHVLDAGLNSTGAIYQGVTYNGNQVGDFSGQFLDTDNFIFDSFGVGGGRSEFIDFDTADQNNDPVSVEHRILILNSNLQGTNFFRKLDREERALLNTLAINPDPTQASWANQRNGDGTFKRDTYLAYTASPGTHGVTTACTTDTPCVAINSNSTCDLDVNDANHGFCVYAFNRRNANPFISNMAGSPAVPVANWKPATAGGFLVPAPAGYADPCNPVSATPATCTTDADCPGSQAAAPPVCSNGLGVVSGTASCTGNGGASTVTCSLTMGDTNGPSTPACGGTAELTCVNGVPTCTTAFMSCGAAGSPNAGTCGPAKTAYYCATHIDASCKKGDLPPLNDDGTILTRQNGKPLYEGYCSLFGQASPYRIGGGGDIQVLKTFPSEGEAFVSLPTYANPYAGAPPTGQISVMVPWAPFQEGVGYPVANGASGGSQDVFVVTAQLDFQGQVITPVMDYIPIPPASDPNPTDTNPPTPFGVSIQAWETQDFLGEMFVCYDATTDAARAGTRRPGDILNVHMYTSVGTIIDWLSNHPGAQTACQIVIRYSPFNNFPDTITSLANGVRLDIDQGFGFGRIVDATVFAAGSGVAPTP
jgi:hypothetical protein